MQSSGRTRDVIDKYYTKPEIATACIEVVCQYVNIRPESILLEPSAGNGAFVPGMQRLASRYNCELLFFDIKPECVGISTLDYFHFIPPENKTIHLIGNPPFGRQSSMAMRFIQKSCEFCESFSFILPRSFKKQSVQRRIPPNFHLVLQMDIPDDSFLVNGEPYSVPCVFQIWRRESFFRETLPVITTEKFKFVKKTESPDVSVRRVGVNAGRVDTDTDKSIQSHYFIRFTDRDPDIISRNISLISRVSFEFNNTVGPKSISKPELVERYESVLQN
jgi:hypothetical protein